MQYFAFVYLKKINQILFSNWKKVISLSKFFFIKILKIVFLYVMIAIIITSCFEDVQICPTSKYVILFLSNIH